MEKNEGAQHSALGCSGVPGFYETIILKQGISFLFQKFLEEWKLYNVKAHLEQNAFVQEKEKSGAFSGTLSIKLWRDRDILFITMQCSLMDWDSCLAVQI